MIDIITLKGEQYSYDQTTNRIFKDGKLLSSALVEPVFRGVSEDGSLPSFAGIYLKDRDQIITLSGNINPVTDPNTITI